MALLKRDNILNANDQQWEDIPVPEWDDAAEDGEAMVRIRGLSADEVDKYERSLMQTVKGKPQFGIQGATARLVAWCLVDENMTRQFTNEDEIKELGKKSGKALARCFEKATELSGLRPGDVEAMVGDFK